MNEIICENCRHFRSALHPSARLVQLVNTSDGTIDATIAEALNRIEEDESRVEDAEIKTIENRDEVGRVDWDKRPLMHGYCALKAHEGRYLIAELVRGSDLCHYEAGAMPAQQPCTTCRHRAQPIGPRQDAANLELIGGAVNIAGLVGPDERPNRGGADNWLGKMGGYLDGIRKRQATEMSRAYKELGMMRVMPHYLPYCQKYSTNGKYALCCWQNPYDSCQEWQSGPGQGGVLGNDVGAAAGQRTTSNAYQAPQQAETVIFSSKFDYKHCGGFGFTLNLPRLVVSEPAGPQHRSGGPQNHYDLLKVAPNQWVQLKNFRGDLLPAYIYWDNVTLRARVGPPPAGRVTILPVKDYSRERQFEPQPNGLYQHPDGGFSLRYLQSYPQNWYIELSTTMETLTIPLASLPLRQWTPIRHARGGLLPLKIYRDQARLLAEWLALDEMAPPDGAGSQPQSNSGEPPTTSSSAGDLLKAVGAIAAVGFALWSFMGSQNNSSTPEQGEQ